MKFEDSPFYMVESPHKLLLPFGTFYLTKRYVVAEVYEGEHFDWKKVEILICELLDHYNTKPKLAYITNRVNDYSVNPQIWVKWRSHYSFIVASAIVIYNNNTLMNASIESVFASNNLNRFSCLKDAIAWANNIEALKTRN
ncbi:hypothetical protein PK35_01265 [Tamlana nanhaiensis]|uniref:STAS/SEC14 domain-containing protein n=1 Tax=Neotamlana nanhaiensis TaxID=1382798 RepID=A0A0D7W5P7_9FLAO|nr:hypothetical protein [Tamlana nanhaiensis]KJD34456.1 hypothetical protein PK35_01265 [Tamlana nanhaiensis]